MLARKCILLTFLDCPEICSLYEFENLSENFWTGKFYSILCIDHVRACVYARIQKVLSEGVQI